MVLSVSQPGPGTLTPARGKGSPDLEQGTEAGVLGASGLRDPRWGHSAAGAAVQGARPQGTRGTERLDAPTRLRCPQPRV